MTKENLKLLICALKSAGWRAPIELLDTLSDSKVTARQKQFRPLLYLPTSPTPEKDTEFWLASAVAFHPSDAKSAGKPGSWCTWTSLSSPAQQQKEIVALLTRLQQYQPVLIPQDVGQMISLRPRIKNLPSEVDLIMSTSGTTTVGGHLVGLQQSDLVMSAKTTNHFFQAEQGAHWVVSLPRDHIAGLQTVVRSFISGVRPALLSFAQGFNELALQDLLEHCFTSAHPVFVSLVPTQLWRCLNHPQAQSIVQSLAKCAGILLGGAAVNPELLARAQQVGLPIVTTYGMTETAGGCVYNGRPLPGVKIGFLPTETSSALPTDSGFPFPQRICLTVPWRFHSYLETNQTPPDLSLTSNLAQSSSSLLDTKPAPHSALKPDSKAYPFPGPSTPSSNPPHLDSSLASGTKEQVFVTSDLGYLNSNQELVVVGRADEVANSGGLKIPLGPVRTAIEMAITQLFGETGKQISVFCTTLPDLEWGEKITAVFESEATAQELGSQVKSLLTAGPSSLLAVNQLKTPQSESVPFEANLPAAWQPKCFVTLPSFPLFKTGKINRNQLNKLVKAKFDLGDYWPK